ncbi:MAG: hypothetical protein RLY43_654 [Bacteroidota bacterium]|jgi:hypothetical protein
MKKTCGALVIGLMITTNVYAEGLTLKERCDLVNRTTKRMADEFPELKKLKNIKVSGIMCELVLAHFQEGYDYGVSETEISCDARISKLQEGFANSSSGYAPTVDNSYREKLDQERKLEDAEQDGRIKEYYLNQQRNSFNRK